MPRLKLTPEDRTVITSRLSSLDGYADIFLRALTPLAQHASNRAYFRLHLEWPHGGGGPRQIVVMKLGDNPLTADEHTTGPPPPALPFLILARDLFAAQLPVPQVLADWTDRGLLLLEDLGDLTLAGKLAACPRQEWPATYRAALDLLVLFQASIDVLQARRSLAVRRRFERALLTWELQHFREWGIEALGLSLSPPAAKVLETTFVRLVDQIDAMPVGLTHRDFQSRNLMVRPDGLHLIDFQDALLAPPAYDLVALLRDSYVVLTPTEVDAALDYYLTQRRESSNLPTLEDEELREAFARLTVQRKLKDAGRFIFIDRRKGDPSFLKYVASSLEYVLAALDSLPEFAELRALLEDLTPQIRASVGELERRRR